MESIVKVKIHPVVLFSILDSYERRNEKESRVIGTLLGTTENRIVTVTNCFPGRHNDNDDDENLSVSVDVKYNQAMIKLNAKANPNELLVGWYTTGGPEITQNTMTIHEEVYRDKARNAILLMVDTTNLSAKSPPLAMKAYIAKNVNAPHTQKHEPVFIPVDLAIEAYEAEKTALLTMQQGLANVQRLSKVNGGGGSVGGGANSAANSNGGVEQVIHEVERLREMLAVVRRYVVAVVNKEICPLTAADNRLGRAIFQTLLTIPRLEQDVLSALFQKNSEDLLMFIYLAQIAKTQMRLNGKLVAEHSNTMLPTTTPGN